MEITRLRHCRSEIQQALKDMNGSLLNDILEQMDREIRELTDAFERAMELADAVQFADTLFEETEWEVKRLYENIAASAEMAAAIPSGSWKAPAHIAVARGLTERTVTVPEWLSSAAEQFFHGTFS